MKLCMYIKLSVKYTSSSICTYFESVRVLKSAKSSLFTAEKGRVYMLKKTWYSSITFIIHEHTGLQGCDFRSQLTQSTSDFPVNSIWMLGICQINSWEIQQRTNVQTMMKVQVADSWQTQLRGRFQCSLQSVATCTQQLHLYCPPSPRNGLLPLPHWWPWWLQW